MLTAKAAVMAVATVIAVGGVATAAGIASRRPAHDPAKDAAARVADARQGAAKAGDLPKPREADGPTSPDEAARGLCQAWGVGGGHGREGKADAHAFEALAEAAGGTDGIAAFCAAVTGSETGGTTRRPTPEGRGPDLSGPATDALCRAWNAGAPARGEQRGAREQAAAFQSLIEAAGGPDQVKAFCGATGPARRDGRPEPEQPDDQPQHPTPPTSTAPGGSPPGPPDGRGDG